ncbi:hypothetical protein Dimus_023070 [Dionaea muscipula]
MGVCGVPMVNGVDSGMTGGCLVEVVARAGVASWRGSPASRGGVEQRRLAAIFSVAGEAAASGTTYAQIPDVWINMGHVYFAQGYFMLAVKMYENCMRKFYYNTDTHILLYLARTHYEAEEWRECGRTLLRAIHLAPSNYTFRFNVGVVMRKFSASTLNKARKNVDEDPDSNTSGLLATLIVLKLCNPGLRLHAFDKKKIDTHVGYYKHVLETARIHCEASEREDWKNKQRAELAHQLQ